jgi:hypothetical protein
MDLFGPIKMPPSKNLILMLSQKYPELVAIQDKSTPTLASAFFQDGCVGTNNH